MQAIDCIGLTPSVLLCFGLPLLLLLIGAGLVAALAPQQPELALVGLSSLLGMVLFGRARIERWLSPQAFPAAGYTSKSKIK